MRNPAAVPAPAGLEDRRVGIYRELLFNNISGLLAGNFPVIRRLLDEREWQALVRSFYVEHGAHTPLFHELGSEFVRFLGDHPEHWQAARPFLHELAHYEWAELAVDVTDVRPPDCDATGDLLDGDVADQGVAVAQGLDDGAQAGLGGHARHGIHGGIDPELTAALICGACAFTSA